MVGLRPEIRWYLKHQFAGHLRVSDVEPSEEILPDDPIWSFLDHLCQIVYYLSVFCRHPNPHNAPDVWFLIRTTLHWVQRHQEVGSMNYRVKIHTANAIPLQLIGPSNVHANLQHKLCTLTDRIYNQILYLNGSNGKAIVTICPPILATIEYGIRLDHARSSLSRTDPVLPSLRSCCFDNPCEAQATGVSHDLLLLGSLNPSLTEYLTNRTRSKHLYVDPNTYHTQMAELWLDQCLGPERDDNKNPYATYTTRLHDH